MRILILLLVSVFIFSASAFCDQPQSIFVVIKEGGIDVVVTHPTSLPEEHYIQRIEISLNGKIVAQKDFTSQTDERTQQASFDFLATKKGDTLEITAYCSSFGKLKKKLTV
jgi:desulfoferrodoxin (superoxide reductase-like protein)